VDICLLSVSSALQPCTEGRDNSNSAPLTSYVVCSTPSRSRERAPFPLSREYRDRYQLDRYLPLTNVCHAIYTYRQRPPRSQISNQECHLCLRSWLPNPVTGARESIVVAATQPGRVTLAQVGDYLRPLMVATFADLPPWQIKFGHWAAANQRDGQITSDFQKSCQAPKSKIFCFCRRANQFTDSHCPVPQEGRFAIVTDIGCGMRWTQKASGAQWQSQGEMNLVSGLAGVQDDRRFLRTAKPCGSGTRCWC
jgi:hypothetical protein